MRSFPFIILFLFAFAAEITMAAEQYPYSASVAVTETSVRSGPGKEFYPTSQLWLGDKVEVYYETEEWCAIRPPIGSFSWISARYVELGTNNIGSVIADGLASRVGCENTELCDTVQVKLKKGEKVFVLERYETPENTASPLWYKIAPPSGEFRWILRSDLMASTPIQAPGLTRLSPKRSVVQVAYEAEEENFKASPLLPPPTRPVRLPNTAPVSDVFESQPTPKSNLPQNTPRKTLADIDEISLLSTKLALNQPAAMTFTNSVKEVDPFQKAFEELKEETRIALVRPTEDWVFDTLIHRGGELYEVAPTEKDLEKTYQLVETLQRTKAVRQEIVMRRQFKTGQLLTPPPSATPYPANYKPVYAQSYIPTSVSNSGAPAPMTAASAAPTNPVTSPPVSRTITAAATNIGKAADFDIVGTLAAFEPLPKGHPPYAVCNKKEEVICLISPASGVDLKPYLGKNVGINGILGIFEKPGLNRRHITAREVMLIE